jgi:voltage-gated potassium channel
VWYFAITTLTTVGFGDLRPYSTLERIFNALLLFGGVMIFSYIIGNFLNVLDALEEVNSENEHADDLSRFFGIL